MREDETMRGYAWRIAAGCLTVGAFVVGGCSQKTSPVVEAPAEVPAKPEPPSPGPAPAASAQPEPIPIPPYELDPSRHIVPSAMATGLLDGKPFTPEALIEAEYIIFQVMKPGSTIPDRSIRLNLGASTNASLFQNRKLVIKQEQPVGPDVPEIMVMSANGDLRLYSNGYALTLELASRQNWRLPGRIYLCLPDEQKTVLAGVFVADYPRQATEPPGPMDLPIVKGSVNVVGAAPKSTLRVGYAANPMPQTYALGSADIELGEPVDPIRWLRSTHDQPHITTLIAGDGKMVASRYEHSRLTSGRYLVFASLLPSGPAAWKWVTVKPGETNWADFTIDATQTGGVEVTAPLEAVKTVQMAPADDSGNTPMDAAMFTSCAWQLGLEQPIITRKAVFKNLTPGRYEVRANGQVRYVEIVAGKTVELDFDKTLTPTVKLEVAPPPHEKTEG